MASQDGDHVKAGVEEEKGQARREKAPGEGQCKGEKRLNCVRTAFTRGSQGLAGTNRQAHDLGNCLHGILLA